MGASSPPVSATLPDELLLVGAIVKAHALKGEVVVLAFNPASPVWARGSKFALLAPDPRVQSGRAPDPAGRDDRVRATPLATFQLTQARPTPEDKLICAFTEVVGRDASEKLIGHRLAIPVASLPPADEGYYHHELRGLLVVDTSGRALGKVVGVLDSPAQDLLEVATDGVDDTWFVPFVDAIVKEVDIGQGRIVVDPPEGLAP